MKYYFLLLISFFSITVFSQTVVRTEKIKITIGDFTNKKTLQDLIPSLPKDCPISEYQFAIDSPQLKKTITLKNELITNDLKSIVKEMKAGQTFYIEKIKSNCKTTFKNNHIFVIF